MQLKIITWQEHDEINIKRSLFESKLTSVVFTVSACQREYSSLCEQTIS